MAQRHVYGRTGLVAITLLALAVAIVATGGIAATGGRGLPPWHLAIQHLGLDLGGGTRVLLRASPHPGQTVDARALERTRWILALRLSDALGVSEPVIRALTRRGCR